MSDKDRAEFEAYIQENFGTNRFTFNFSEKSNRYCRDWVDSAWRTWQHEQRRIDELKKQIAADRRTAESLQPLLTKELNKARERIAELESDIEAESLVRQALSSQLTEARELIQEASDYLNTNELTSIGHGSILHRKMQALNTDNGTGLSGFIRNADEEA